MSEYSEQQFVALVQKAEADASNDLNAYKTRLAIFAVLGYAVIFTVLILLLVLVGGTVAIAFLSTSLALLLIKKKIIFVILIAIWTFLKALWIKFDPPVGYTLKRELCPVLFAEIDELTKTLDALKIHQIILDEHLNAAVVQHPRFGVLGGQQNTLILGLQLLLALSPQEMRSVLAHEFGHLSGNHSRFSAWIYRIRLTWHRVMLAFDDSNSFGAKLMRRFFDWYAPKFSAYSFALARNNEYEADRVAVELTSPDVAAKALVNVYATAPYIDQVYWDVFFRQADEMPEPPGRPYEGLADFLKETPISRDELVARINTEMAVETHYADTHPALKDRIDAITSDNVIPDPPANNAAEIWLGSHYQEALDKFDQDWLGHNQARWKDRYDYVTDANKAIKEYKNKSLDELNYDELWDFATWVNEFEGIDASLPIYRAYQTRDPESIGAAYYIGKILIGQKNEEALGHLKIAFGNPNTLEDAAQWGYDFLKQQGEDEKAEVWREEALQVNQVHREAYQEREQVTPEDYIEPAVISDELLEDIKRQLSAHKNVGAVWLAQKVLKHNPNNPAYVVAFRPRGFYMSIDSVMAKVSEALEIDADIFVVSLWGNTKKLGKKIKKIGTKIL